ncbi:MAG: tetratricopeptide repeat protein [Acidobacteria bacterium]|nr:tetratricopeptide repeat protein [Acidobacteriota bacterium]
MAHFARGESAVAAREAYLVPLSAWAAGWRSLSNLIKPLEWKKPASHKGAVQAEDLYQIRSPVRDFIGRRHEISLLVKALRGGAIAGINGMGGIGKTELALSVAEKLRAEYSEAQLFLDMRGADAIPVDPADALAEFLRIFGRREEKLPEDVNGLSNLYQSRLSGKRVLILLDNVADRSQIKLLVPPRGCGLLITSRDILSLEGMKSVQLEQLTTEEARKLLTGISKRTPPDIARQICSLCGRLPLAIRAAGSLLNVTINLEPEDYVKQLSDERTRLKNIGVEGVDIGVEASFNLSYANLLPETARVFRELSVFPSSFDDKSEEVVCEDAGHAHLTNLVRRSLVLYDGETRRYRLHDLMRLFAGKRLAPPEGSMAAKRHSTFYAGVLRAANDFYIQGGQSLNSGLLQFDTEWSNIETGRAWAKKHIDTDKDAALLCSDYPCAGADLLGLRQSPLERIEWLESALVATRRMGNAAVEADHLRNIGLAYTDLGEHQKSLKFYKEALVVARREGDQYLIGDLLGALGRACCEAGRVRRALEYYDQWLGITRSLNHLPGQCRALRSLGSAYAELSEIARAIDLYQQSLLIAREIGNPREENATLSHLGDAHANLGEMRRAIEFYEQALDNARRIEDYTCEALMLNNLGDLYVDLGDVHRAIELYERRLDMSRRIADHTDECLGLIDLGDAYECLEEFDRAIELYEQALSLARRINDRQSEGQSLSGMGNVYADSDDLDRAADCYQQDLAIMRELGDRRSISASLNNLANVYAEMGESERAIGLYKEALALARKMEDRRRECETLSNMGNAYADMDRIDRAMKLLQQSISLARKIGNREGEYQALSDMGTIYVETGKYALARGCHERALKLAVELGDLRSQANSCYNLSLTFKEPDEQAKAISYAESAVELYTKIDSPGATRALEHLAQLRGQFE